MTWKERAKKLKKDIRALFLALKDCDTPIPARLLAGITVKCIPKEVLERNREQAEGMWKDGKPKKWYYAIPIVLIWGLILVWLGDILLDAIIHI